MKLGFHMRMTTDVVDVLQSIKCALHEFEISHYVNGWDLSYGE